MAEITRMREITLSTSVRVFDEHEEKRLARRQTSIPHGATIMFGEPALMLYDHRSQVALPFKVGDETYWVLLEEMKLKESDIDGIEKVWIERLHEQNEVMSASEVAFFKELRLRMGTSAH